MSVDYDGGMVVGNRVAECSLKKYNTGEDPFEWAYENGLEVMSPWFDCSFDDTIIGFEVEDVAVSEMTHEWFEKIEEMACRFRELCGAEARLIGTQNIW